MRVHKPSGAEVFESTYQSLFGPRWEPLKAALLKEREPVPFQNGLVKPYFLDQGSILAAETLPIQEGDTVLDMCAAPGGKSLILESRLKGTGRLVCNDRSQDRRSRLKRVIEEYVPQSWRSSITISGHDATQWGLFEQQVYDKILLDAPCSSERHVLVDPKALGEWSPARPKHLAIQQFAMLCAALEAVKVGGLVLYSTCALIAGEDEEVIAKLEKKRAGRFELIPTQVPLAEDRSYGQIILPDTSGGKGPLYFCLLRRLA
ncbi:MAG: RsmB/NOP family class I SAM-dependent RNA methyltransferase [Sphaerochaetaceae bacterium]|nr:RsmB/NOP family class I SAM-dependent RNA methyltransferase [Spirochaetales bacterium]MDY5500182.1 RsmB/NOP family class I SAM-dependent RNA methyltransferase [Sphaerochaetaceae bacterium]